NAMGEKPLFLFPEDSIATPNEPIDAIDSTSRELDQSVTNRINAIIDTAVHFWSGKTEGDECPNSTNHVIPYLMDNYEFSKRNAEAIATIIRPDWAKNTTWADNTKR
ncbi:hypothetical protein ACFL48_04700, partial [Pseudomonadota bacterium]